MHSPRPELSLFDLRLTHVALPDWYILRLPESFTDFFFSEFGGNEIAKLASKKLVVRCLFCGKALTNQEGPRCYFDHASECGMLSVMIIGPKTPCVCICTPPSERMSPLHSLYVTAHGDDDVGLSAGNPLILSHERRDRLVRDILSGEFKAFL
jgi:hypothetical protein